MHIKNIDDIETVKIKAGKKSYRQILISEEEAPNFAMRRFIIEPGGEIPNHTNSVEHEQYILNGSARIGIGEKTFEVKKNDAVFIPADVPHWYKTLGDVPFEFICVVPNKPDVIKFLEMS
jgi:quercetin dioxygenase-like cupin family protein